jgi:hypothetical protein
LGKNPFEFEGFEAIGNDDGDEEVGGGVRGGGVRGGVEFDTQKSLGSLKVNLSLGRNVKGGGGGARSSPYSRHKTGSLCV